MLVTGGIYWAQILNETLHTRNLNCSNSIFLLTVAVRRLCLLVGRTLNLITRLISPINFPHCTTVTVPTIALCKSPSDLHQVTCCWSIQSASPALIQISNYGLDITFKQNVYWKIAVRLRPGQVLSGSTTLAAWSSTLCLSTHALNRPDCSSL